MIRRMAGLAQPERPYGSAFCSACAPADFLGTDKFDSPSLEKIQNVTLIRIHNLILPKNVCPRPEPLAETPARSDIAKPSASNYAGCPVSWRNIKSSLRSSKARSTSLLYLIKKEEVDIYEVNLTKLAKQFIEYTWI